MNKFGDWLKDQLRSRDLKQTQFADLSGLSRGAISSVINGQQRPGFEFCDKTAKALGLSTIYVMRLAGIIEENEDKELTEDAPMVKELVQLARSLPEGRLKMLLEFARLLRRGE